ncbi:MAG: Lrp/AsnC family transcriptional regulator [Synergistaceae bacterium]|nr:Lrp/AsnC family transcriptional regulator [Synergistaceae bacterium]
MSDKKSREIDDIDWGILDELQKNARIPFERLAEMMDIPISEVAERVKLMEDDGIIMEYRAVINPRKVGYALSALISVSTDGSNSDQIINNALEDTPEVISCWSVTGASDYLLEVHVSSLEFLEELLSDLAHHGRLTTSIVLPRYAKNRPIKPPRLSMTD